MGEMAFLLGNIKARRGKLFLFLILLLTAFLTCWKMWEAGNGNQYYTAAVKSMLTGWHNFFYVSYDQGGFISVDKPPLGLWLQCLFALVFGVRGWSVILPSVLSALGSVLVVYGLVKKSWGEMTALLACLFMALTPIFAVVSRTNNLDAPLVFVCLLAVRALLKAAEEGSLKHILLTMVLLGFGFNIKMLQAYMFLPAVYLVYFFTAEAKCRRRVVHLVIATVVLLAVSLSWCLVVDLTPASNRPFVGSSSTNSTIELAVGYNGLLRALPVPKETMADISGAISQVPNEGAGAGILRFFNKEMAGQASWLLPMAVFGLIAIVLKVLQKDKSERKKSVRQLLLWGGIFVPMYVYFSISGHIHRYYLIMFVPCLAVLAAVAVTEFERRFKISVNGGSLWQSLLLPLAFAVTAAAQVFILKTHAAGYSGVLVPVVLIGACLAVLLFIAVKALKKERKALTGIALAVGLIGLLAAPAYWAYAPIRYGTNVITPFAGPPDVSKPYEDPKTGITQYEWGRKWYAGQDLTGELIPVEMVNYIKDNDNGSRWQLAVPSIIFATPLIISDDVTVMPLGGFIGTDKSVTLEGFKELVQAGKLQYFLVTPTERSEIISWVMSHGKRVDPAEYSKNPRMEYYMLYDLSGLKG